MDPKRRYSYSNLFNLESLINFQLPQLDDDFDYHGNSSQDESRGSPGGATGNRSNGIMSGRELKKKRRTSYSSDEDGDRIRADSTRISEEKYRTMLGEHVQRYKRRLGNSLASPAATRNGVPMMRSGGGSRDQKSTNDRRGGAPRLGSASEFFNNSTQSLGNHIQSDFPGPYGGDRFTYEPAFLDLGEDITYKIPPPYEKLATSLNLPSMSDIQVNEICLKGTLDLETLAAMMASDKKLGPKRQAGMGDPKPQFESLQARLRAQLANSVGQKFSLQVTEAALEASSMPEGAAGSIRRSILSDGGVLQVYYVKVLEKGDTYEIIERSLPKKPKLKKDPSVIEKEEMDKIGKYWISLVRKEIPKHHKIFINSHRRQLTDAKRFAETCQREVKMKVSRSLKVMRGAAIRTRKLARDMLVYWKRVDKEMAEVKKREEKEAAEALKREQELREAKRQQQRLNFLLSQTELYSHFMQNKSTLPSEAVTSGDELTNDQEMLSSTEARPGEEEDPEDAELRKEALKAAQDAVSKQKMITSAFDNECLKLRQAAEIEPSEQDAAAANIDLLHPSTMPVASTVQTPELFKGTLKDYQLKGLQWLVNCYEQGLNGILADEMGLGKTIQAMAFLAHLAEEKNIWGPFLVVAPASVLNNWADEIGRFCPDLKTLPYWGGLQERVVLRKNINPKRLYRRDAGFHILITSYQLLVSDEKYFRRVKWQYMVLDEAQAIKSASSIRWKTLLSFNCRNRLLLTGTPIQNNMAELWALLHFIMPTLFDSHEQFNEWFSKGIENHAEHGGSLNEHQLSRLHAILKPFMLRRVKKDVVTELTGKTEITVHCKLSSRQQAFYQAIKNKISLAELFDSRRGHLNEKKLLNLMNIVIQLRKVCNHPELFERNEGSSYFYFGDVPNSLLPAPFGELEDVFHSGGRSPVTYRIPKLVYREANSSSMLYSTMGKGLSKELFEKYFNIYSPENIHRSILHEVHESDVGYIRSGTFGFTRLIDMSPMEVSFSATGSFLEKLLFSIVKSNREFLDEFLDLMESEDDDPYCSHLGRDKVRAVTRMLLLPSKSETDLLRTRLAAGSGDAPFEALVMEHQDRLLSNVNLLHSIYSFIPKTRAPPINAHCSDRTFAYKMLEELHHPWIKRLLVGFARTSEYNGPRKPGVTHHLIQEIDSELPVTQPALELTYKIFGSCPPMQPFDPAKMLTDSGKLQTLDILLKRLRAGNHRVLIFAQMTKMLDILEDYMHYRKHRYLRLDGSSTIMDRRDMVKDFQHRSDIFVFMLSTRAGGLGINLTAADTVIFYESDWNPTLDLQAMDRAHRLGQTKDVTVYRLICKETVEEKILQRASQKNTVQQLVMTGGHVQGDLLAPEDVVSLLIDDAQLEQKLKEIPLQQAKERQKRKGGTKGIRIGADGDASLEDLTNSESVGNDALDLEKPKSSNKKRKSSTDKQTPKSRPLKNPKSIESLSPNSMMEDGINSSPMNIDMQQQRPKRLKRPTKSVNESLEPAFTGTPPTNREGNHNYPSSDISSGGGRAGAGEEALRHNNPFAG
ncbi:chromatin-remodeling ATPase INO80 isoform X1 [Lycium barbarum]|uniref:chromatin-remodeling ATPase INO80 isoform X1 n=2 Tax=Lycium barbarum TaxID=112863 RepID=UPI00293E47B1|nr:chromatin-remodeling ATPase INO80 isoform X1 [Lycium barbarum]